MVAISGSGSMVRMDSDSPEDSAGCLRSVRSLVSTEIEKGVVAVEYENVRGPKQRAL